MPDPLGGFDYTWPFYAVAVLAYLVGAIPFGVIVTRLAGAGDVRKIGSGNIGATNVLRTGRKSLAAITLVLDGAKGALPVLIAQRYGPDMAVIAAAAAVIGHVFPIWLRFRGGKGVATALGALLAIAWPVGVLVCATWLALGLATRYSSIASLGSMMAAPFYASWLADPQRTQLAFVLAVVVVLRHHANIRRLLRGEESKISFGGGTRRAD